MPTQAHDWRTVAEQHIWNEPDKVKRQYYIGHSFPDTLWGRLNAFRMVEAVKEVFGPDGAFMHVEVDGLDLVRHVCFYPQDVVCEQVRLLKIELRDCGWLDASDFVSEMLPLLNTWWQSLDVGDRLIHVLMEDLPFETVLMHHCPIELHNAAMAEADA